ncbi:MAG TPA: hypothetical protein VER03_09665 [Bryobacteraceae bacterium]|nr:hypothetical protein [Bryobacteraceae bacterium]
MLNNRLKHASAQFGLLLLNTGALGGWMMILLAVLIVLVMAQTAS